MVPRQDKKLLLNLEVVRRLMLEQQVYSTAEQTSLRRLHDCRDFPLAKRDAPEHVSSLFNQIVQ